MLEVEIVLESDLRWSILSIPYGKFVYGSFSFEIFLSLTIILPNIPKNYLPKIAPTIFLSLSLRISALPL